jgi:pimeloyl-ACP methyl ester carboxylesterase
MIRAAKSRLVWNIAALAAAGSLLTLSARAAQDPEAVSGAKADLGRKGRLGVHINERPAEEEGAGAEVFFPQVVPGGAAADAGVQAGDAVSRVNGQAIRSIADFLKFSGPLREGDKLQMDLRRADGSEASVEVVGKGIPRETHEGAKTIYDVVEFRGYRLRSIITKPEGDGPFPAVYFIPGVTCLSIELSPNDHIAMEPCRRLASELPKRGFVFFRVEKSGMGDSEGPPCSEVDFETDAAGFQAGLEKLKSYGYVDPENVFIFGHSMGGVQGPMIAAKVPVKGVAAYGTGGINWVEYMVINERRQLVLAGHDPVEIEDAMRQAFLFDALFYLGDSSPKEIAEEHPELRSYVEGLFPDGVHMMGRHYAFWRQLGSMNFIEDWRDSNARALAIWGSADFVTSREEHQWIAETVNHYRPGQGEFLEIDGADHLMLKAGSPSRSLEFSGSGYAGAEIDWRVVDALLDWLERSRKDGD